MAVCESVYRQSFPDLPTILQFFWSGFCQDIPMIQYKIRQRDISKW